MHGDVHEFVPFTNGRFPNSCLRCGRTKQWHEEMLARLRETAEERSQESETHSTPDQE